MSSIHLPSFFNNDKKTTLLDTKSMRFKRSTFTTTATISQEYMNTEMIMPEYELGRSNTLTKKVKRFGSMLVRGKKSSRPNMPQFSPPTIDVDLLKKNDSSFTRFSDSSSDDDEENLMTPIDSISPQVISNTEPCPFFPVHEASTPVTKNKDVVLETTCLISDHDGSSYTPIEDTRLKLNLALLVQRELSDAFEVADKDIEADLEISRRIMLQSII